MQQYFIDEEISSDRVVLNTSQSHHIKNVLRMKEGKKIQLVDSVQQVFLANIAYENDEVVACITQEIPTSFAAVQIELQACLIKGDRWDVLLQKASELGVHTITPIQSRYCVVKIKDSDLEKKRLRWETICTSACEQSKRHDLVTVREIQHLSELSCASELKLVAYEDLDNVATTLQQVLQENDVKRISICIGPEGGFHPDEISDLISKGYQCVNLGQRILRAETAGIVSVDRIMNYYEGEIL